ncbi:MAG: hypothetical protein A2498_02670 [Lentisphaerae bacterium RIFOXYC12_FULL_60_16]|nr:MAG: hypothetical protein A2498_02670 [Lentisphaerae bacterium RIFOXYC12_FULL_60_16]
MNAQAVAVLCLAAITGYVGLHHLLYFLRMPTRREFLYFACACLAITHYNFATMGVYAAGTPYDGSLWQVQQVAALAATGIFILLFVVYLVRARVTGLAWVLVALWILHLIALIVGHPSWMWTDIPSIKHVSRFGLLAVYYEMKPGWLVNTQSLTGLLGLIYMLALLIGHSLKPEGAPTRPILAGMIILALAVINDSCVSAGLYTFFYTIEYAFLCLVVCMAWTLANLHYQTVRRLQESETRYRNLLETATDGVVIVDARTERIVEVNRQTEELVGHTRQELVGQPFTILYPTEDATRVVDQFHAHLARGRTTGDETRILHRNGRHIPVEISSNVLCINGNDIVQGMLRDITQRKASDAELHRLAAAVEAAAESIVITDATGIIQYVNPCFERMTGYSREEAIGRTPRLISSGKHDKTFYQGLWATVSSGQVWRGTVTNRRKDGTLYEEEAVISPVRNYNGEIVNYVSVRRDITQEVALENQLRHSQKMEAIGRLAGGIAHDFTNMLVIILNHAQFARKKLPDDSDAQDHLKRIIEASERSASLTSELMAFAHQKPVSLHVVDLNKTLRSAQDLLTRAVDRRVSFHLEFNKEPLIVEIDPDQLEEVVVQLVVNGCEAMANGGHLTLHTSILTMERADLGQLPGNAGKLARERMDFAVLSICDNGTGLSDDVQAHLFEPFFTTKGKRGTGLGLSTSYGIIKKHHGFIVCYSQPEHGACFRVLLPLLEIPPHYIGGIPAGKETVLVVESQLLYRTHLIRTLQDLGYRVLEAEDDQQARDLMSIQKAPVALAVLNIRLGTSDGRELAQEFRHKYPAMKILYTSGFPAVHLVACGDIQPGEPVISLPFSRGVLARIIRTILGNPS